MIWISQATSRTTSSSTVGLWTVTTLKGAATLLREMPHDSDARERLLARIERAGRRLGRLIQTFLMLADPTVGSRIIGAGRGAAWKHRVRSR